MVERIDYPREIGSTTPIDARDWNRKAPFGHCPACGSLGIENSTSVEGKIAKFSCSDEQCLTYTWDQRETLGSNIVGRGQRHTDWSEEKPEEWRREEREGEVTWNSKHFDAEFCEAHDLI